MPVTSPRKRTVRYTVFHRLCQTVQRLDRTVKAAGSTSVKVRHVLILCIRIIGGFSYIIVHDQGTNCKGVTPLIWHSSCCRISTCERPRPLQFLQRAPARVKALELDWHVSSEMREGRLERLQYNGERKVDHRYLRYLILSGGRWWTQIQGDAVR